MQRHYQAFKRNLPQIVALSTLLFGCAVIMLGAAISMQNQSGHRYILQYILKHSPSWAFKHLKYAFKNFSNATIATIVSGIGVCLAYPIPKKLFYLLGGQQQLTRLAPTPREDNLTDRPQPLINGEIMTLATLIVHRFEADDARQQPIAVNTDAINNALAQSIATIESFDFPLALLVKYAAILDQIFNKVTHSKKLEARELDELISSCDDRDKGDMKEMLQSLNEWSSDKAQTHPASFFQNINPEYRPLIIRAALTQLVAKEAMAKLHKPLTTEVIPNEKDSNTDHQFTENVVRIRQTSSQSRA